MLLSFVGLGAFVVLAAVGPFHSGAGTAYTVQRWAEVGMVELDRSPGGKAHHLLDIAARRNRDLIVQLGSPTEQTAFEELEQSVGQAVQAVTQAPPDEALTLRTQLLTVMEDVLITLPKVQSMPAHDPTGWEKFQLWHAAVLQRALNANLPLASLTQSQPPGLAPSLPASPWKIGQPTPTIQPTEKAIAAHFVYFPADSPGARHEFYPLSGKHLGLDCQTCHTTGAFSGTPARCSDCHASVTPVQHYPGSCDTCHVSVAWKEIHFDHKANPTTDCLTCHTRNAPPNHFQGQCSLCHTISAWLPATFNHTAVKATNCVACHTDKRPVDHYSGQCSLCHSTQKWKPAQFDHKSASADDCASCHQKNTPDNHFSGACSACHATDAWKPAHFDHAAAGATDCQTCHTVQRPAGHYSGQCSACHTPNAWNPATFNHAAASATDCGTCHASNTPANHFTWQCSECHTLNGWVPAAFNHTFPMDHNGAGGQCANCHKANTKDWACTTCHAQNQIDSSHQSIPGYVSNCMVCHANGKKPGD